MNEKLIAGFAEILECEASDLNSETVFRDHESWDSLAYLSAVAMIDEEFGVVIPQDEFRQLKTIGEIETYISSHRASA